MSKIRRLHDVETIPEILARIAGLEPDQVVILYRDEGDEFWDVETSDGLMQADISHAAIGLLTVASAETWKAYMEAEEDDE